MDKDTILAGLSPYVIGESQRWDPGVTLEIIPARSRMVKTFNQPGAVVCVKPDGKPEQYMIVRYHVQDGVVSQVEDILHLEAKHLARLREKGVLPTR